MNKLVKNSEVIKHIYHLKKKIILKLSIKELYLSLSGMEFHSLLSPQVFSLGVAKRCREDDLSARLHLHLHVLGP